VSLFPPKEEILGGIVSNISCIETEWGREHAFYVKPTLFNIMSSSPIHVAINDRVSFFFKVIVYIYHLFFSVNGHLVDSISWLYDNEYRSAAVSSTYYFISFRYNQ
jgi:hypothetical protein